MDGHIDLKWLLGLLATFAVTLIAAFRHLAGKVSAGDATLHGKIDDVKEKYVRRDDYRHDMDAVRRDLEKIDGKLDELIKR